MTAIVIMAGGGGTRLFPASTSKCPKQFVRWPRPVMQSAESGANQSLIQQTYHRLVAIADEGSLFVATTAELASSVREQLPFMPPENLIVEPFRRNSAGACALATARVAALKGPDTVVAIVPSDALVGEDRVYQDTLRRAMDVAFERSGIVVVAIRPTKPSTGYGYIRPGDWIGPGSFKVKAFVEKPDSHRAERLIEEGCQWNAGIFVWRAEVARQAFETFLPLHARLFAPEISLEEERALFEQLPGVSIDVGVAEKAENVYCVVGHFPWDDLGTWDAFGRVFPADASGNVGLGLARFVDSQNCVTVADEGTIVALGLENIVVVRFGDTVLVCPRECSQDVGKLGDK